METNFLIHRQTYFRQYTRSKKKSYARILGAMLWNKTFQFNDNGFKALFGILVANTSIGCTLYTVQYTQPAGLWSIENKIMKIIKYSITHYSRCNLCFHQICAHLWMSSRNAKVL